MARHAATRPRYRPGVGRNTRDGSAVPSSPDRWLLAAASALFVFLCIIPVTAAFRQLSPRERGLYAIALLASIASALLIAGALATPPLVRRRGWRDARLLPTTQIAFAGRAVLTVALAAVADLELHRLAGEAAGVLAGLGVVLAIAVSAPVGSMDGEEE